MDVDGFHRRRELGRTWPASLDQSEVEDLKPSQFPKPDRKSSRMAALLENRRLSVCPKPPFATFGLEPGSGETVDLGPPAGKSDNANTTNTTARPAKTVVAKPARRSPFSSGFVSVMVRQAVDSSNPYRSSASRNARADLVASFL